MLRLQRSSLKNTGSKKQTSLRTRSRTGDWPPFLTGSPARSTVILSTASQRNSAMNSDSCWRFSMVVNLANSSSECIEQVRHSRIRVHDAGTGEGAVFLNLGKEKVRK